MQQRHAGADRDEVGGDVQRVRRQQPDQEGADQQARGSATPPHRDEFAETLAGGQGGAVTDFLHRGHQREGDQADPQHAVALRRAGLAVGRDTGRVIVAGPGDQTGADRPQVIPPAAALGAGRQINRAASIGLRPRILIPWAAAVPGRWASRGCRSRRLPSCEPGGLDHMFPTVDA